MGIKCFLLEPTQRERRRFRRYSSSQRDGVPPVRHGTPPRVTVDKNGNTCTAGGGSIQTPGWHGFLVDGELREQR